MVDREASQRPILIGKRPRRKLPKSRFVKDKQYGPLVYCPGGDEADIVEVLRTDDKKVVRVILMQQVYFQHFRFLLAK